jgi:hypothetical protein
MCKAAHQIGFDFHKLSTKAPLKRRMTTRLSIWLGTRGHLLRAEKELFQELALQTLLSVFTMAFLESPTMLVIG